MLGPPWTRLGALPVSGAFRPIIQTWLETFTISPTLRLTNKTAAPRRPCSLVTSLLSLPALPGPRFVVGLLSTKTLGRAIT